jgi:hypothetical protein
MAKKNNNALVYIIGFGILYLLYKESKKKNIINVTNILPDKKEVSALDEPRRFYDSKFISRGQMAINVPTRGEPPEYQQVGLIKGGSEENIKPLYGRQTYRGSNQWNYFTSLDSHLATKIPVYLDDSDCTGEMGCKELNKGDTLSMGDQGPEYTASIYGTVAPRYIPY